MSFPNYVLTRPKTEDRKGLWILVTLKDGTRFDAVVDHDLLKQPFEKGLEVRLRSKLPGKQGPWVCILRNAIANAVVLGAVGVNRT